MRSQQRLLNDFWKGKLPPRYDQDFNHLEQYQNLGEFVTVIAEKYGDKPVFTNLRKTISFRELDELSSAFAAYIQHETDLKPGDRIAVQMPNLLQYVIAAYGIFKAGMILVNTNPLYTTFEMAHQFRDADARAIIILANMAQKLEEILPQTSIKYVFVTEIGDMLSLPKRIAVNAAIRHIKKLVPRYRLPSAINFRKALHSGTKHKVRLHPSRPHDVAVLQYTGGTTGISRGAMLTHSNLLANAFQVDLRCREVLEEGKEIMIAPLPLYHIFAFTTGGVYIPSIGGHVVLITNPRDIPGTVKTMSRWKFTAFCGLNTLFVALTSNRRFAELDFSSLKATISGGMACTSEAAREWHRITGNPISEGYGLSEASPVVCLNPLNRGQQGTIGLPIYKTEIKLIDDEGREIPPGMPGLTGELCVRGPQVMKGYWGDSELTSRALSSDGWLRTGDMAEIHEDGFVRLVDRKKDMIIVSGFKIFPNEIEDVLTSHPKVMEAAIIGIPDPIAGELVKAFIVPKDPTLTKEEVARYCHKKLTGYKRPKEIEFHTELPKTPVGKVLRRALR
jgi:long-chain acyl-CoA synthetase